MQGLPSNSALFWAPEKAGLWHPLLIFFPPLALGTPQNAGVREHFRPLLGLREGRGEVSTSEFLPAVGVGDPRECKEYVGILPSFGPPRRQG